MSQLIKEEKAISILKSQFELIEWIRKQNINFKSFINEEKENKEDNIMNDTILTCISNAKFAPYLCKLDIRNCKQITDVSLNFIAQTCFSLDYLDARGTSTINPTLLFIELISQNYKWITLHLEVARSQSLTNINRLKTTTNIKTLKYATIPTTPTSTTKIKNITSIIPEEKFINLIHLETLSLKGFSSILGRHLQLLSENALNLRELDLTACSSIKNGDLRHIAAMNSLESLCLDECIQIDDSGIAYLCDGHFPNIPDFNNENKSLSLPACKWKRLSFQYCIEIGDTSLEYLLQRCIKFESNSESRLNNNKKEKQNSNIINLQELDLRGCYLLNWNQGWMNLLLFIPYLKSLHITVPRDTIKEEKDILELVQSSTTGWQNMINWLLYISSSSSPLETLTLDLSECIYDNIKDWFHYVLPQLVKRFPLLINFHCILSKYSFSLSTSSSLINQIETESFLWKEYLQNHLSNFQHLSLSCK